MHYKKIAIIGGSGFIGSQIAANLADCNREIIIPTRRRERHKEAVILLINTQMIEADLRDDAVLRHVLQGCDAVINATGILHGSRSEFDYCHVELPSRLLAACKDLNIRRFIHISTLGADVHAPSNYLETKAHGEQLVRDSDLDWTIFRPSAVFGDGDDFLCKFAKLLNLFPMLPLAGAETKLQPVWVQDLAKAIVNVLGNPASFQKTYDMVGPDRMTLREVAQFVGKLTGNSRPIIALSPGMAMFQATVLQLVPGTPLLSFDSVRTLMRDSISDETIAAELQVTPSSMFAIAPQYLGSAENQAQLDEFRAWAHR